MKRNLRLTAFGLFGVILTSTSVFLAQPGASRPGDQVDQIQAACGPILNQALSSESVVQTDTTIKDSVVSDLCQSSYQTVDEAEKAGFNLGVVVDGVPLSAMFDSDQKRKSESRAQLCTKYNGTTNHIDKSSLINRIYDPQAKREYNQCVANIVNQNSPIYCALDSDGPSTNSATLTIVYRKLYNTTDPKVVQAEVTGGVIYGRKSGDLGWNKRVLPLGYNSFRISRPDPTQPLGVILRTTSGISCPLSSGLTLDPQSQVELTYSMQPVGQTAYALDATAWNLSEEHGCGDDVGHNSQEFSLSQNETLVPGSITSNVNSSNCPSGASGVDQIRAISSARVHADYHTTGCGFTSIGRSCKGRGWLDATIMAKRAGLKGEKGGMPLAGAKILPGIGIFSAPYSLAVPDDFSLNKWIWQANASTYVKTPEGPQSMAAAISETKACAKFEPSSSSGINNAATGLVLIGRLQADVLILEVSQKGCDEAMVASEAKTGLYLAASGVCREGDGLTRLPAGSIPPFIAKRWHAPYKNLCPKDYHNS